MSEPRSAFALRIEAITCHHEEWLCQVPDVPLCAGDGPSGKFETVHTAEQKAALRTAPIDNPVVHAANSAQAVAREVTQALRIQEFLHA